MRPSWIWWLAGPLLVLAAVVGWRLRPPPPAPPSPLSIVKVPDAETKPQFPPLVLSNPYPATTFTLTDQNGREFNFRPGNGQAALLFFGYTFCPDVCPGTLADYGRVAAELGTDARRVQFIFVSVDPERDTPARLKEYLTRFDPSIIGLTGTPDQVAAVLSDYGILAEKEPLSDDGAEYGMMHTATGLMIDPAGTVRVRVPFGARPEETAEHLQRLLRERG